MMIMKILLLMNCLLLRVLHSEDILRVTITQHTITVDLDQVRGIQSAVFWTTL